MSATVRPGIGRKLVIVGDIFLSGCVVMLAAFLAMV